MHFVGAARENNQTKFSNTQKKENNENADWCNIYLPLAKSETQEEELEELFLTHRQSLEHQQVQLVFNTFSQSFFNIRPWQSQ